MGFNSGFKGLITQAASGVVPSVVDLSWVAVGVRLSNCSWHNNMCYVMSKCNNYQWMHSHPINTSQSMLWHSFISHIHDAVRVSTMHLSLHSPLNVSNKISHPYKTTDKIMLLYILIFKFLDSKLEDKRFCTEWWQAYHYFSVFLISSWIEF